MRRALLLVVALGCGGGKNAPVPDAADPPDAPPDAAPDAFVVPVFRNPVALPDPELATAALQILGANIPGASVSSCNICHNLTRQQLRNWRTLSDTAMTSCLTDLALSSRDSAKAMIECLRAMPDMPQSDFEAKKLGIYASAVHLPWFDVAVHYGYGNSAGTAVASALRAAAGMPRNGAGAIPLTQPQFDIVAEWFVRGLPLMDQTLPADPPPTTCTASVSVDVAAHVMAMQTQGWRALNNTAMMAMYGCGGATTPLQCLAGTPIGSMQPYGTGWDVPNRGKLRILADVTYRSSYWSRSSPDGRFIGHGVQNVPGSYIIDLQRGGFLVPINTQYDPNWFPDNSGFVFQGGTRNTCAQSVLTSNPSSISMTEAACTNLNTIGLYEHVGAVAGGDHFAIDSRFVSDDGGHSATLRNPFASFGSTATIGFIPLIYNGTTFTAKPQITIGSPFEGDTVLSPSARLIVSRVAGPGDVQLGFVLRRVEATPVGTSYSIQTPEIARYCVTGGKPGFSYDERWMAYHHYVTSSDAVELGFTGPGDPAFAPYLTQGAANIYLLELATGVAVRITNMRPGQYALFPHFRSDGWIYANVRDVPNAHEYMVASDAALLAE